MLLTVCYKQSGQQQTVSPDLLGCCYSNTACHHADVGPIRVKLIDMGNCFSISGTDASRVSFEMQTLPFRAPEVMPI